MTRTAARKSELDDIKASHSRLLELFWQLKTGDALEVGTLVRRIKSDEGILDGSQSQGLGDRPAPGRLAIIPRSVDDFDSLASERIEEVRTCSNIQDAELTEGCQHLVRSLSRPRFPIHPPQGHITAQPDQGSIEMAADLSDQLSLPDSLQATVPLTYGTKYEMHLLRLLRSNFAKIREGFALKRTCISEIFFCHDTFAFDKLFAALHQESELGTRRSVLCEMCAVAATSGQYVRNVLSPGLLDFWYCKLCNSHFHVKLDWLTLFVLRRSKTFSRRLH